MKVKEVVQYLEEVAPRSLQEGYDNSGLICGSPGREVSGILVCLDSTEEIVEEALSKGANLIVAHHPIVFSGLKSLTGKNYIERTIIKAVKHDVAIYAIHTNLDNVSHGVNRVIGEKLGVVNQRILAPKKSVLSKVIVYVPKNNVEEVRDAVFEAGAGEIGNYSDCSFASSGIGTFKGNEQSNPVVGKINERHFEDEHRLEVLVESWKLKKVISAMIRVHPYEEVAYDVVTLENQHTLIGAGGVGDLEDEMGFEEFLAHVAEQFNCSCIRHTKKVVDKVKRVAFCGGSGSFLLPQAKASGADVFITGDFKYHQFFDAEDQISILDIGHFESEQFTIDLLGAQLREKFPNFALHLTEINTNPVNYYTV